MSRQPETRARATSDSAADQDSLGGEEVQHELDDDEPSTQRQPQLAGQGYNDEEIDPFEALASRPLASAGRVIRTPLPPIPPAGQATWTPLPPLPTSKTLPPVPATKTMLPSTMPAVPAVARSMREHVLRKPEIVAEPFATVPLRTPNVYPSVAPVSLPSSELKELEPPRRGSRLAYTAVFAATFLGALYMYRSQPGRPAAAARPVEQVLQSPIAAVFKSDAHQPAAAIAATPVTAHEATESAPPAEATARQAVSGSRNDKARDNKRKGADESGNEHHEESASASKSTVTASSIQAANEPADNDSQPEEQAESLPPFNASAAQAALAAVAGSASSCLADGDPSSIVRVNVTFAPTGNATTAWVEGPPFAGTPQGGCIARMFRAARVEPFQGTLVTVRKTLQLR